MPPLLFGADPDVSAIGSFVQVFMYIAVSVASIIGAVAGIVVLMRRPEKPPSENYVTRAELQQETTRNLMSMKGEIARLETEIRDLRNYTSERTHDMGKRMHVINLRIVYIMGLLTQLCAKQGIVVPSEPTISPADET